MFHLISFWLVVIFEAPNYEQRKVFGLEMQSLYYQDTIPSSYRATERILECKDGKDLGEHFLASETNYDDAKMTTFIPN